MDDQTPRTARIVAQSEEAYEAVRAICHLPFMSIPGPVVYDVLGNLKLVGGLLRQVCEQISDGLDSSLDDYEVYEDDCVDPSLRVAETRLHLAVAALLATDLGEELSKAQMSVTRQGFRSVEPAGDCA